MTIHEVAVAQVVGELRRKLVAGEKLKKSEENFLRLAQPTLDRIAQQERAPGRPRR